MDPHALGPSYPGSVLLDIGGQYGALVIYAAAHQHDEEIEITSVHNRLSTHASVRERRVGGRSVYCAVFSALAAGDYTVWRADGSVAATATVVGGAVVELRPPTSTH